MKAKLEPRSRGVKRQSAKLSRAIESARCACGEGPHDIGYMARLLIQATMPHRKTGKTEHVRKNGDLTISMLARREVGLPFGTYPRLILHGITTEVVRDPRHPREIELGGICEFMRSMGLAPTGGKQGSIRRLQDHMKRLFACAIAWTYDNGKTWIHQNVSPVERAELWWDPKNPEDVNWKSSVLLTVPFHREILAHHVPLDSATLRVLAQTRSPLALDIYSWGTHRVSHLSEPVDITWPSLMMQFGAEYGTLKNFRVKFLEQARVVNSVYPGLRMVESPGGITLWPSPTHVPPRGG